MKVAPTDKSSFDDPQPSTSWQTPTDEIERIGSAPLCTDNKKKNCAWSETSANSSRSQVSWSQLKLHIAEWRARPSPTLADIIYRTPKIYRYISIFGFFIFYMLIIGNYMYIAPKIRLSLRKVSQWSI